MKRTIAAVFVALAVWVADRPVGAHHSFSAEYDATKPVTLKGSVTKIEWMNPHIYFHLDVKDDKGVSTEWSIEGGAPNTLYRAGWRRDSLKFGDVVTVHGFLARDGTKLANMRTVILADGREVLGGQQVLRSHRRPPSLLGSSPTAPRTRGAFIMGRVLSPLALGAAFVLSAMLGHAGSAWAQGPAPVRPDLSGFWVNQYTPDLSVALGKQPPFTALGAERWRTVDTSKDPTATCLPVGPSRGFTAPFPFLLVQNAETVSILFEYQAIWRAIYLDGRGHPEDIEEYPYFMGHSVGRWEGDTLVVDTTGIDERSWLDTAGHEHSAKLRLTERLVKTGADTVQWTVTYDDPVFFTRPWSITRTFTRGKPGDRLLPYTCNENNRDVEHLRPNQPNLNYKHTPEPPDDPKAPKRPGA